MAAAWVDGKAAVQGAAFALASPASYPRFPQTDNWQRRGGGVAGKGHGGGNATDYNLCVIAGKYRKAMVAVRVKTRRGDKNTKANGDTGKGVAGKDQAIVGL